MVALPDDFWAGEEDELVDILMRHLYAGAVSAGQSALAGLGEAVSVDFELVNETVRVWAKDMSLDLVKGITETSRTFTTDAISKWVDSGAELGKLGEALEPMFGPVRSEMIASTEVTRAFAEGNRAAWQASGVVDGQRWRTAVDERVCPVCGPLHNKTDKVDGDFDGLGPPAHPRCRCWTQPVVNL